MTLYTYTVLWFRACLQLHWVGGGSKVAGCNIKPSITPQIRHFTSHKHLQLSFLLPQVGSKPREKRLHHESNDGAARPMNTLHHHIYAEHGRKVARNNKSKWMLSNQLVISLLWGTWSMHICRNFLTLVTENWNMWFVLTVVCSISFLIYSPMHLFVMWPC